MSILEFKKAVMIVLIMAAIMSIAALGSCATTIIPPASPQEPTTVYLLDHGRTPSLVLPGEDGTMARYVYGDWDYYALRKNDLWHGMAALLWPTPGTLGRKVIQQPDSPRHMLAEFEIHPQHVHAFEVDARKAARLRRKLDEEFESNIATLEVNEPYALEFVHHPRKYTGFYNSNHALAAWLRQLDCEIRGSAMFSDWKVNERPSEALRDELEPQMNADEGDDETTDVKYRRGGNTNEG